MTSGVVYVWAVGSEALTMPSGTGFRLGTSPTDPPGLSVPFVYIQFHYSNPARTLGLRDSSGVRIRITDAGVPIDAGVVSAASS